MVSAFSVRHAFSRLSGSRQVVSAIGSAAIVLGLWISPASADPFRSSNPRSVGLQTEAAFEAMFRDGNYQEAARLLQTAETNEPLSYAMKAALGYINEDWGAMGENARLTRETAEQLQASDPLRGNLYVAVGHFLEGAYTLSTQETVAATPAVLGKLQQVFSSFDAAERIDPNDPELNLIKGYMDLMLAVNLPFANPEQAVQRLEGSSPTYVSQRGIAIGYRDLRQEDQALSAVNRAIQAAPNNPDLYYLKAQILVRQERDRDSLPFFQRALDLEAQLPQNLANQIAWEECRTRNRVNNRNRDCSALLDRGETE